MEEILYFAFSIIVFLLLYSNIQMHKEITRINKKLNDMNRYIGFKDPLEEIEEDIKNLLLEGKKIKAIKICRDATGIGLKEAKDYVDSVKREMKN